MILLFWQLLDCASAADSDSVKKLLRVTDPERIDKEGFNALMWAVGCERGPTHDTAKRRETVRLIAEAIFQRSGHKGLDALDGKGCSALHWAAVYNLPGIIDILCQARLASLPRVLASVAFLHKSKIESSDRNARIVQTPVPTRGRRARRWTGATAAA